MCCIFGEQHKIVVGLLILWDSCCWKGAVQLYFELYLVFWSPGSDFGDKVALLDDVACIRIGKAIHLACNGQQSDHYANSKVKNALTGF